MEKDCINLTQCGQKVEQMQKLTFSKMENRGDHQVEHFGDIQ